MKNKNLIGILIVLLTFISCDSKDKGEFTAISYPVIIVEFAQSKFHHADTTNLTIHYKDSIDLHLFGLSKEGEHNTILDSPFEINPNDEAQILIGETPSELVSKKNFAVEGEAIVVRKYHYNPETLKDEEGYYFIAKNRVIAFNSSAWDLKRFYKYDNLKIAPLLKKDSSDFFYNEKSEMVID